MPNLQATHSRMMTRHIGHDSCMLISSLAAISRQNHTLNIGLKVPRSYDSIATHNGLFILVSIRVSFAAISRQNHTLNIGLKVPRSYDSIATHNGLFILVSIRVSFAAISRQNQTYKKF